MKFSPELVLWFPNKSRTYLYIDTYLNYKQRTSLFFGWKKSSPHSWLVWGLVLISISLTQTNKKKKKCIYFDFIIHFYIQYLFIQILNFIRPFNIRIGIFTPSNITKTIERFPVLFK